MNAASILAVALAMLGMTGCTEPGASIPAGDLTFAASIEPIVAARCAKCHVEGSKGELSLASLESVLAGGKSGPAIVPGDAAASRMYLAVSGGPKVKEMPPKGDRLTKKQVATIKAWINAGGK
jgi:hypothetical protein